jgi:uncharacterized protein DUF1839
VTRQVVALDPAQYERHPIHGDDRVWTETNCYVDIWIELLHALGHDPVAALPFTLAIDFEGDQWTFFKYPLVDLYALYGLDVQELNVWRPLVVHLEEQVSRGRPVLVELDSFYLPDTTGTAYQRVHVKTTVAVMEIDVEQRRLGYFHGQGFHRLSGDDFVDVLRLRQTDPAMLPPYTEIVKIRETPCAQPADEVAVSLQLLARHLALTPSTNPFVAFHARFSQDLAALLEQDLDAFHQYSFATLRQYGAAYELAATYLRWLEAHGERGLDRAPEMFQSIAEGAKRFQFQLARAMARRTALDLSPLAEMGERWECGIHTLKARYQ